MKNKSILIATGITLFFFLFIVFLIYLIYCYAFYDKHQEEVFIDNFNSGKYSFLYDNMNNNEALSFENINNVIKFIYDKKNMKDIYYLYYKNNSNITLDELLQSYYFGDKKITLDNVTFKSNGDTSIFTRRKLLYDDINLVNKYGSEVSLGVKENVILNIENKSSISVDGQLIECLENTCKIDKIFGGLHEINYSSNGYDYYGILNIFEDNEIIDITVLDSLVRISNNNINILEKEEVVNAEVSLNKGKYILNKCFLNDGCPSKYSSYLLLNEDGSCVFYTYITLDQAGDYYAGKYEIINGFLVMYFVNHTYQVFDYDTKESTDIVANVDIEMRFKLESNYKVKNDSYEFIFIE